MPAIRVLLVDDAVVIRNVVPAELNKDPDLEVVGVAANGVIALAKIPNVQPDIVLLDIEMPVLDGLETLRRLRQQFPKLPVIMFSTLTERGAAATLDALSLGASDYLTKPSNLGDRNQTWAGTRDELIRKIKHLCSGVLRSTGKSGFYDHLGDSVSRLSSADVTAGGGAGRSVPTYTPRPAAPRGQPSRVDVVVIGVSTGGPNALLKVLPDLPADLGVPVLIVQHMPPVFTRLLAERLDVKSQLHVREGWQGAPIGPNQIWLAPGDYHMGLARQGTSVAIQLNQNSPENFCRPAVDVLFRDAASVYGKGVLAVVLTGMGQDGLRGCERIRDLGGQIIIQDQPTSVVWGMPGAVARKGLADTILPLDEIAGEITRRVKLKTNPNGSS